LLDPAAAAAAAAAVAAQVELLSVISLLACQTASG